MATFWLKYRGTRFPIRRDETTLGRSAYCSIVLDNALASRQHCVLRQTPTGLTLTDLSSTNGTRVNGNRITGTVQIKPGDSISVGTDTLDLFEGRDEGRATASDPASLRSPPTEPFPEETSTATNLSSIELIEALVRRGGTNSHLMARAAAVEQSLETLLDTLHLAGVRLPARDRARLHGAITTVASWFPDGSRESWAEAALGRIEREHGA